MLWLPLVNGDAAANDFFLLNIPTGRYQGSMNLSHAVAAVQAEVCSA